MGCQEVAHKVAVFPPYWEAQLSEAVGQKKNRPLRSLKGSAKIIFASVTSGLAGAVPKIKNVRDHQHVTLW